MRQWDVKDFRKVLKDNGFQYIRNRGSHEIYKNANGNEVVIKKKLNPTIALRLIKENKLEVSEYGK